MRCTSWTCARAAAPERRKGRRHHRGGERMRHDETHVAPPCAGPTPAVIELLCHVARRARRAAGSAKFVGDGGGRGEGRGGGRGKYRSLIRRLVHCETVFCHINVEPAIPLRNPPQQTDGTRAPATDVNRCSGAALRGRVGQGDCRLAAECTTHSFAISLNDGDQSGSGKILKPAVAFPNSLALLGRLVELGNSAADVQYAGGCCVHEQRGIGGGDRSKLLEVVGDCWRWHYWRLLEIAQEVVRDGWGLYRRFLGTAGGCRSRCTLRSKNSCRIQWLAACWPTFMAEPSRTGGPQRFVWEVAPMADRLAVPLSLCRYVGSNLRALHASVA